MCWRSSRFVTIDHVCYTSYSHMIAIIYADCLALLHFGVYVRTYVAHWVRNFICDSSINSSSAKATRLISYHLGVIKNTSNLITSAWSKGCEISGIVPRLSIVAERLNLLHIRPCLVLWLHWVCFQTCQCTSCFGGASALTQNKQLHKFWCVRRHNFSY